MQVSQLVMKVNLQHFDEALAHVLQDGQAISCAHGITHATARLNVCVLRLGPKEIQQRHKAEVYFKDDES